MPVTIQDVFAACFMTALTVGTAVTAIASHIELSRHRPFCPCKDCVAWRKSRVPEERK